MATATTESVNIKEFLASAARWAPLIRSEDARYLGPCVVQAPAGWTRVGPTWLTSVGWVTIGAGAANWGTKLGLAELASLDTAEPTWHAVGLTAVPEPPIVYAVTDVALKSKHMKTVRDLARQVGEDGRI